jgi:hypothetical protein
MRRLHKFLILPAAERRLLISAVLLLGAVRLGLWFIPFQTLRRILVRLAERPTTPHQDQAPSREQVVQAVETAARLLPWAKSCLTQALTAQVLLTRRGYPALLHIGVVRSDRDRLEAHAWVESGGEVVIGGFELERYTPLAALGVDSESPA